jgi:hypothetical protein
MLKTSFIFLFLLFVSVSFSQTEYTYVTDTKFLNSDELLGYVFMPNEIQTSFEPGDKPQKIGIGKVKFRLTMGYLYVTQGEEELSYNTNSINPEKYGFKVDLMNARNPSEQGHLKIILNDLKQVDALIFKKNRQSKEVTYYQAMIREETSLRDQKYFTDKTDIRTENIQYLFTNKPVKPFFVSAKEQKRLYPKDSLSFTFSQKEVTVGKKTKMEYMVTFKYLEKREDFDPITKTQEYVIKKFEEVEFGMKGKMQKSLELELKDFPEGKMYLFLTPINSVEAIRFGDQMFVLRDKKVNGLEEKKE